MRTLDRIVGWWMVAVSLLQAYLCLHLYIHRPELLLWSLMAVLAQLYLAAMNLIRAERRHDLVLARLCVVANATWIFALAGYAALLGGALDRRVLPQLVLTVLLLGLSLRARNRSRPM